MLPVEFVSYDGKFPNLCCGKLVLRIHGKERTMPTRCLHSGGCVTFDENEEPHIENGPWGISLPEDLEPLRVEIEACINQNIPQGCCGGCL